LEAEVDGGGDAIEVGGKNTIASDSGGVGYFLVISRVVGDTWGVVRFAGPKDGHETGEEVAVVLEVEDGLVTGAPDAETGFADDGRILPTYAEIDFRVDTVASIEQCPCSAAAEAGLLFIRPLTEGN